MRGSCLCGGVAFEADPPYREVVACHCTQCRKTSGHYWAAASVPHDRFRLTEERGLAWFRSSPAATRGFCRDCGASLFWQPEGEARISFAAGCIDGPSGLTLEAQWFGEDAGDYYSPEGPPPPPSRAETLQGSCLCGANRFTLPGPMGAVTACHCSQCRKTSGHYAASFDAEEASLVWQAQKTASITTPGGGCRTNHARSPGHVFYHHALLQFIPHRFGDVARDQIRLAGSGKGNNQSNGFALPSLLRLADKCSWG